MKLIRLPLICFIILAVFNSCSKKSGNTASLPALIISNVTQNRNVANSVFQFSISINSNPLSAISVAYKTVDGTAVANKDYIPVSGKLTIPANTTTGSIDITVIGDSLRQANQTFYIQLSNPENCTLASQQAIGLIINENGLYLPVDTTGYSTPKTYSGYTLTWSDEFDSNQINTNNWTFEEGNNNGWGNNELEYYTSSTNNAFVSSGSLIIEARQEQEGGYQYTSARMKTQGLQNFTYGRIDIRAILPQGQGIWPALWMLGSNITSSPWPSCGEIDIMELLGQTPNKIYGTLHWGTSYSAEQSSGSNYTLSSGNFNQQFNVYSLIWKQDSIKILVDDQPYFSIAQSQVSPNPFNSSFFFIFNIAVGGQWPGSPDNTTIFPQRMVVDYVRVFQ